MHLVDPATGRVATTPDPLGPGQTAAGLALQRDLLLVGGSGASPSVGALSLVDGRLRWRVDDVAPDGGFVLGLAVRGTTVFGLTTAGWLVAVDLTNPRLLRRRRIAAEAGRLRVTPAGGLFAITPSQLLAIDPVTLAATEVIGGLGSMVWGWPPLAVAPNGDRYVIRGRDLVRVSG